MRSALFVLFVIIGVAVSLLLGGCAALEERPVKVGSDTRTITLERSYLAQRECSALLSAPPGWKIVACAYFGQSSCTIKMLPDATDDTLGHEARHCFDGSWHRR